MAISRRKLILGVAWALVCLPYSFTSMAADTGSTARKDKILLAKAKPPQGFASLAEPRQVLADVYHGGKKIAETSIIARPGFVRFQDPQSIVAAIPSLSEPATIGTALTGELPANSGLVCSEFKGSDCGKLSPESAGIIFDESRFRIDLFVNPRLLQTILPVDDGYLQSPARSFSMTSSMGLSLSGSVDGHQSYNVQNRTILAMGNARLRASSSFSSGLGLVADDFVAEVERRNLRYSAGMFWIPGLEMVGQRRIIGAGVTTQVDTRIDKDLLEGTPLFLFLDRAARVEIFADGRLLDSRVYEAGNNQIDTSQLPGGAYSLLLRINQTDGSVREERRFFARNAQIAPVGRPIYFAFAGLLAKTRRNRPFSPSQTLLYQAGMAHRLSSSVALDAMVVGTQHKSLLELGGYFLSRRVRTRAAALISTRGDKGALLQLGTSGSGPLSFNFDLRRIWSGDGKPLIPLPIQGENFDFQGPFPSQLGYGSYTQMSGSVGYRVRNGFLALTGAFRRDGSERSDYSIGPSLSVPLAQRHGLQVLFQADAQRTRSGTSAYAGFRLLKTAHGKSVIASAGYASVRARTSNATSSARPVGSIAGEWSHQSDGRTEMNLGLGAERTVADTHLRGHGAAHGPLGSVRGDLIHHFGDRSATHYGLSLQTGIAANASSAAIGGRELTQSALMVTVEGQAEGAAFDVLVDEEPHGRIATDRRLPIYLQAYRSYSVRLKPVNAAAVSYDGQATEITLFPGTVRSVRWAVQRTFTLFGQAVDKDGAPIGIAQVETRHGIGQTDEHGYFQVDIAEGDEIRFSRSAQTLCRIAPRHSQPQLDYAALGKVICQ